MFRLLLHPGSCRNRLRWINAGAVPRLRAS
jgi:hypothetical protein